MATLSFDGSNDYVRFDPIASGALEAASQGPHTLVCLQKRDVSDTWRQNITLSNAAATTAISSLGWNGSTLVYDRTGGGGGLSGASTETVDWLMTAVTLSTPDTPDLYFHFRNHTDDAAWTHGGANTGDTSPGYGSASARLQIGRWLTSDYFDGLIGLVAVFDYKLSNADLDEIVANDQTSDLYNCSSGPPVFLVECNTLSLVDLMGEADLVEVNGPVLTGPNPDRWTFDGIGAPSDPATEAGQYGWGTYGEGNYGDSFGGVLADPKAGSDAFTMSESAVVTQFFSKAASETFTFGDTGAVTAAADRTDLATLAEAINSIALSGPSDAATLAEAASVLATEAKAANDSATLGEAYALTANLDRVDSLVFSEVTASIAASLAASDAGTLSELAALSTLDLKTASDAFTLAEAAVLAVTELRSASDTFSLSEALAITANLTGTDLQTLAEAAAVLATVTGSDSWALTEASDRQSVDLKTGSDFFTVTEGVASILTTDYKEVSDTAALGEVAGISATVTAADIQALLETSAINAALLRSDAWSLTELADVQLTVFKEGSDTQTLAEALGLSAQVAASDTFALSEALAELADTTYKLASDSFSLTEESELRFIVALTASDSFTLSAEVAGIVEYLEAPYIHHKNPLGGIVQEVLAAGLVLIEIDAQGNITNAVTAGAPVDYLSTGAPSDAVTAGTPGDAVTTGTVTEITDDGALT